MNQKQLNRKWRFSVWMTPVHSCGLFKIPMRDILDANITRKENLAIEH